MILSTLYLVQLAYVPSVPLVLIATMLPLYHLYPLFQHILLPNVPLLL